ncbi:MAG TPA: PaaI family thioesterase [Candidatus Dormibacteraeota bacterium]|nr:PaaI family thioesterase [Candidatus Dormibacteraeota bacterium]
MTYDRRCFGCGVENPQGLQLQFENEGEQVSCEAELSATYQSWQGIIHGGVVALLMDEAVGWAAWHAGHPGVTGKLEVRLRQPLKVGERVRIVGRVDRIQRRLVYTTSTVTRASDGSLVAEATATLMASPTAIAPPSD